MSMVTAYITEHFIVMTGDYRRVHIEDNSEYFDDARKLFQINDSVLIGYTGDYAISLKLQAYLDKKDLKTASPAEIARICRRWLNRRAKTDTQQRILIGGLDAKGKPAIIELTHDNDYEPTVINVEAGRIDWRLIYANVDPTPFIEEELGKLEETSPDSIAELARKVNERVAGEDSFISPACDVGVLICR
ncbi:hypothetical protein J2Z23_000172 [Lederbergia galactosidilyticus]|uniref:hypothetical protein n=1 Tax=Lederbergia galactosidilytica TaxID=217031 RepID=UPI001AE2A15E|nr:hypothetical protein [Lederbergia galactosidilytica]MBP1913240.1 hypothetical protein [Lederbergia galactosidilytica]